jgi:predicted nuclease with TOPRIM domain
VWCDKLLLYEEHIKECQFESKRSEITALKQENRQLREENEKLRDEVACLRRSNTHSQNREFAPISSTFIGADESSGILSFVPTLSEGVNDLEAQPVMPLTEEAEIPVRSCNYQPNN